MEEYQNRQDEEYGGFRINIRLAMSWVRISDTSRLYPTLPDPPYYASESSLLKISIKKIVMQVIESRNMEMNTSKLILISY